VELSNVLDVFARLVDKSLVVPLSGAGENHYRLLASIRAFALEKLAASRYAELARLLCEHMTFVMERAERSWGTTATRDWLAAYEPELDNLRAALGWSLGAGGDPPLGMKLLGYTYWLWRELSLAQEQRRWIELALTFVDDATPPVVEARIHRGLGWYLSGSDKSRLAHNLRAIELLRQVGDEPVLLGHTLGQAGASSHRNVAQAEQYYDEALAIQRRGGRTKWLADALNAASSTRREAGDLQTSRALTEEGLALGKALGDLRLQDSCEVNLAHTAFVAGQMAEAIDRARRGSRRPAGTVS
jgi:predicted ATPase